MCIINEYVINYIKANWKNNIALFLSIMVATLLISTYVFFIYSVLASVGHENAGNYDFEIYDLPVEKIELVKNNEYVEEISIYEKFIGTLNGCKSFIKVDACDELFWKKLSSYDISLDGNMPQKPNEVILNETFFRKYPKYKIGDEIELKLSYMESLSSIARKRKARENKQEETKPKNVKLKSVKLKIVGSFSYLKGYKTFHKSLEGWYGKNRNVFQAVYFLDKNSLSSNDKASIKYNLKSKKNAYEKDEAIKLSLGFKNPERCEVYSGYFNEAKLLTYGQRLPSKNGYRSAFLDMILYCVLILIILTIVFVAFIYNVFQVMSNKKLRQIAMIKSIGASKKQILKLNILDIIYRSILPILLGTFLGMGFSAWICAFIGRLYDAQQLENLNTTSISFYFAFRPLILIILFAFLTVLIASFIPSLRLIKLNIIDAIKGNIEKQKKKKRKFKKSRLWQAEMRKNNFRTFKGTSNAIFMTFLILFILLTINTSLFIRQDFEKKERKSEIYIQYHSFPKNNKFVDSPESIFKDIIAIPELDSYYYNIAFNSRLLIKDDFFSDEFKKIKNTEQHKTARWYLEKNKNNEIYIYTLVWGLDDSSFKKLVEETNGNINDYYGDKYKGILVNKTRRDMRIAYHSSEFIPLLDPNLKELNFDFGTATNKNNTPVEIGASIVNSEIIETMPIELISDKYFLMLILPLEKVRAIQQAQINTGLSAEDIEIQVGPGAFGSVFYKPNFISTSNGKSEKYFFNLNTSEENIPLVRNKINKILSSQVKGSDTYTCTDILVKDFSYNFGFYILKISFFAFLILVFFGACVNAYSSIKMNLYARQNEFAILYSVGADQKIFKDLFKKEIAYFILNPLLKAIPFAIVIMAIPIHFYEIIFVGNFLKSFNWVALIFFTLCLSLTVIVLYKTSLKKVMTTKLKSIE